MIVESLIVTVAQEYFQRVEKKTDGQSQAFSIYAEISDGLNVTVDILSESLYLYLRGLDKKNHLNSTTRLFAVSAMLKTSV